MFAICDDDILPTSLARVSIEYLSFMRISYWFLFKERGSDPRAVIAMNSGGLHVGNRCRYLSTLAICHLVSMSCSF